MAHATATNNKRATAAKTALVAFASTGYGELIDGKLKGFDFDLRAQNITDLLTNLAHYCDREGLNLGECLASADSHYTAERREAAAEPRQSFDACRPKLRAAEPPALKCPHCAAKGVEGTLQTDEIAAIVEAGSEDVSENDPAANSNETNQEVA